MMNIFNIKNLLFAAMMLLASSSFTSCGSSDETSMPQQVKQYFDKDITLKNAGNHTSAYFDLSDGVVLAYKNKDAASFLNATVKKQLSQAQIVQLLKTPRGLPVMILARHSRLQTTR